MSEAPPLDLDDYDFELPPQRIAQRPAARRDDARLLCFERRTGALAGIDPALRVRDLPQLLRHGDLLVRNATRVLPARLRGHKRSGAAAEALLLGVAGAEPTRRFRALVKTRGRLRVGLELHFDGARQGDPGLAAELVEIGADGAVVLCFEPGPSPYSLGEAPLPPYIRRDARERDEAQRREDDARYQTVYAREPGAVAAPTAGLHLTSELLEALTGIGVRHAELVLHVGAGTFRPLRPEDLARGRLHAERYALPAECADAIAETRAAGGRVIAVGTTSARVLESCAATTGSVSAGSGQTDLFLRPGSRFRVVDGLLTNFHLPRSSLLLLVAAFAGREPLLRAYRQAIEADFRFYSYGDAMLIV